AGASSVWDPARRAAPGASDDGDPGRGGASAQAGRGQVRQPGRAHVRVSRGGREEEGCHGRCHLRGHHRERAAHGRDDERGVRYQEMTMRPTARDIVWRRTASAEVPYEAEVDGRRWVVRVNDFPAEPLYTLLVDGVAVENLEAWPKAWKRPPA